MAKYHFICNPASRSGLGIKVWNSVEGYLKENAVEYDVSFSKKQGHVAELVGEAIDKYHTGDGPINVIILGGDGTLDEALQGISDFSKVYIGYIPTGSGNDFARSLAYSADPIENLKDILAVKEPLLYDLGKLEYLTIGDERSQIGSGDIAKVRYFDVSCGIGFDAAICERALASRSKDFLNRIGLGKLIYVLISLKIILGSKTPNAVLTLDNGEKIEFKKLRFVVGMNTCYEGGGYKFAPEAVPDDGFLDICVINNISSLSALGVIPTASKGTHITNKHVKIYHVKSYEVKTDIPMWVHTDGEVYTTSDHIRVSVVPGVLRFLRNRQA